MSYISLHTLGNIRKNIFKSVRRFLKCPPYLQGVPYNVQLINPFVAHFDHLDVLSFTCAYSGCSVFKNLFSASSIFAIRISAPRSRAWRGVGNYRPPNYYLISVYAFIFWVVRAFRGGYGIGAGGAYWDLRRPPHIGFNYAMP